MREATLFLADRKEQRQTEEQERKRGRRGKDGERCGEGQRWVESGSLIMGVAS